MDDIDWDNLQPSTATEVGVRVRDFTNRVAATRLGEAVGGAVLTFGSFSPVTWLQFAHGGA